MSRKISKVEWGIVWGAGDRVHRVPPIIRQGISWGSIMDWSIGSWTFWILISGLNDILWRTGHLIQLEFHVIFYYSCLFLICLLLISILLGR